MKKKILSYAAVLIIGAAIGTWFDAKHTIEEKVVYKDRVKTQIREIIKEAPDGTKITERIIDRNEKRDTTVSKKESRPVKPNWGVGVKYELFVVNPIWTIEVDRRIIGDVYINAYGRTDGVAGVGIRVMF